MDARAGSLWHKTAGEVIPRNNPRHGGGPVWCISVTITIWVSVSKVMTTAYGGDVPEGIGILAWYSPQLTLSLLYGQLPPPPPEPAGVVPGTQHTYRASQQKGHLRAHLEALNGLKS